MVSHLVPIFDTRLDQKQVCPYNEKHRTSIIKASKLHSESQSGWISKTFHDDQTLIPKETGTCRGLGRHGPCEVPCLSMCIRPCAMRSVGCHFKPIAAWLQWYSSAVFWYRFVLRAVFVLSQMVVWGPGRTTQYYALLSPWATSRDKLRHVSNHNLYVRCGRSIRYPLKSLNPIMTNLNFNTKTWFPKKSRQINKKWNISSKINIFPDKSRDVKIFQDKLKK